MLPAGIYSGTTIYMSHGRDNKNKNKDTGSECFYRHHKCSSIIYC